MSKLPAREPKDPLSPTTKAVLAMVQALLPAMTAIIGGLWIFYTYLGQQHDAQREAASRAKQEADTRRIEAQRPFLEKQLALYFEAAQVAGRLAALTPDDKSWRDIEQRFWALYWSELSMVEDERVEAAMVNFGEQLSNYMSRRKTTKDRGQPFDETEGKRNLDNSSYELAHAIRASIEARWGGGVIGSGGGSSGSAANAAASPQR